MMGLVMVEPRIEMLLMHSPSGDRFLLASRRERRTGEPFEATVRLPLVEPPAAPSADVCFEGRAAPLRDGAIADAFLPHAVHVYRIRG